MKLKFLMVLLIALFSISSFAQKSCSVQGQLYTNGATYTVGDKAYLLKNNFKFSPVKITEVQCNSGSLFSSKLIVKDGNKLLTVEPSNLYYLSGCDGDGEKQICIGDNLRFYTFMPRSNMVDGHVDGTVIAFSALIAVVKLPDGSLETFTKDAAFP